MCVEGRDFTLITELINRAGATLSAARSDNWCQIVLQVGLASIFVAEFLLLETAKALDSMGGLMDALLLLEVSRVLKTMKDVGGPEHGGANQNGCSRIWILIEIRAIVIGIGGESCDLAVQGAASQALVTGLHG